MTGSLQHVSHLYNSALKLLLGVRNSTPNDLCYIELGYPSPMGYIQDRQAGLFHKLLRQREGFIDDPFMFAWRLVVDANSPCARYVRRTLETPRSIIHSDMNNIKRRVTSSAGTKFVTYRTDMNPCLLTPTVYLVPSSVPEHHRVAYSRLRLSAHSLAIETGRWSRIPPERRLCSCGSVQTENHVLCVCPETEPLRTRYADSLDFALPDIFSNNYDVQTVCMFIYECLNVF